MRRMLLIAALFALALIAGCVQNQENIVSASLDNPFQLKIGQAALIGTDGISIKFLNVSGDSRCPSGAECVWRGAAIIEISAGMGAQQESIHSLADYDAGGYNSTLALGDYSVKIVRIEPYPKAGAKIRLGEYIATFVVSALQEKPAEAPEEKDVSFETIRNGIYGSHPERKMFVIANSTDWDALNKDINYLRAIDFSKDMLVAVFLGERPSGGYGIEVTRIIETADALEVIVRETSPGSGCPVTLAFTQPYHIVKIRKTGKRAIFNIEEYTAEKCK